MTPNDLKLVLQEVLGGGVYLNTSAFVIFVCASFLAVALAAAAGTYFGKRGETAAVKRDLETIKDNLRHTTQATEEIKAEITGDLWERQNRWAFKRDLYIRLLENLGIAYKALDRLWDAETNRPTTESETRTKWIAGHVKKEATALEEVHRALGVATVILNADAVTALEKLEAELVKAQDAETYFNYLDGRLGAVKEAYAALKNAAKADLMLEART